MRRFLNLLALGSLMAVLSACGDYANTARKDIGLPQANGPNPQDLPNPNAVPKPVTPNGYVVALSPVTIEEVLLDPVGPNDGMQYIELYNASAFEADIGGWAVSNGLDTYSFPYGFRVPSQGRVLVHVGAAGAPTSLNQFAPSFRTLETQSGSLALLRAGNEVVHFVQWGASGQAFEGAATMVGAWINGDYVLRAAEGRSMNYDGTANDSSAWREADISPGN